MKIGVKLSARPELLKHMNQELLLRLIVRYGRISRAALARETGLALPSVMRLTEDLIEKGLLADVGQGPATGGRKANELSINGSYRYIIGVEIASKVIVTLTDFSGFVIASRTLQVRKNASPQEDLAEIAEVVLSLLETYGVNRERVAALGVGTPGFNFKYNSVQPGFMKAGWESIDVAKILAERTGLEVIIENVARTRTLSEIWFGEGLHHASFVYVFVDWGVGIGIVDEGRIVEGACGVAGEFGHMRIERNGRPCYCGGKGCLEMYVSVAAIEAEAKGTPIAEIEDETAYATAAHDLALAIGNMINLLNPPLIVLGGCVPRQLKGFTSRVEANLEEFVFHHRASRTPILESQVDNEGICLGSIALVIHHVLMRHSA